MNHLTDNRSVENLLNGRFKSVIITDIVLKNGQIAQTVTLLSHADMFDETVMGISKALRSGGKAAKWQSRTYAFRGHELTKPFVYPVVVAETQK